MSSIADEIADTKMGRPHIVLLGAGASLAAFPDGDRNGRKLPVLNNLIDTLGLAPLLAAHGISCEGRNFEDLYSELAEGGKHPVVVREIEAEVRRYFSDLSLPDAPTLYDHLVLSLRPKDLIATFNWDPFLFQAARRNYGHVDLPQIVFLHGNVAIGYCEADRQKGWVGSYCRKCSEFYTPSNLLYPVRKKDYQTDFLIRAEWDTLRGRLENAYMMTVFGYSAPKTDVEAMYLLRQAWGDKHVREMEQVEIIDIRSEDELSASWEDFILSHHYQVADDFYRSWIARHPRRTCEAFWNQSMELQYLDDNPIPTDLGFEELWEWYRPLVEVERQPVDRDTH